MMTVFLFTLRESLSRRIGVVLLVLCVMVPMLYFYSLTFETQPDGPTLVQVGRARMHAELWVRSEWVSQLRLVQNLWTLVALFLGAPLMSSYLERGWADLLLTKGVHRWQFLVGRLLGAVFVFVIVVYLMYGSTAIFWSSRLGVASRPFLVALAVSTIGFFCIATMMALVGVALPNTALLVIVGFVQVMFSPVLAEREQIAAMFRADWLKPVLDVMHALLPRTKEMGDVAIDVLHNQPIESLAPIWWSLGLAFAYAALACFFLHRKAI